jgi:DNA-binding LytR/AlgR family response regulator
MNYIIVDDEYIAHDIIKGYCDMLPHFKLVSQCYDGLEALECLRENKVELIFLDLNMPKLTGFDFLKSLPNPPQVIVTTAYKEHALEGYELNIVDYLLKPISFERFVKAINKLEKKKSEVSPITTSTKQNESIFFRSNKNHIQVKLDNILYIEALGNYSKVVTTEEDIKIREKISDLYKLLPQDLFVQVHKSYLIAINHIKRIEGNRIFINDNMIPIGKFYKRNVNILLR